MIDRSIDQSINQSINQSAPETSALGSLPSPTPHTPRLEILFISTRTQL